MRRKAPSPLDPNEWLRRARSNLARAKNRIPEACLEDLCFDAQQMAEKAIKAVCIHRGVVFPFTHDLARLLTVLRRGGRKVPKYVSQAKRLTRFAVETRYPGLSGPVTERTYRNSVRIAEAVLGWAERQIAKP
jgi:HEPN domain-containing protein